eukprot:1159500-Pelagomonas_calceolata.AAC.9
MAPKQVVLACPTHRCPLSGQQHLASVLFETKISKSKCPLSVQQNSMSVLFEIKFSKEVPPVSAAALHERAL